MNDQPPRLTVTISATDGPALAEALDALRGRLTDEQEQDEHGGQFGRRTTRWEQRT